jgi:HK97 family phage portal protein
LERHASQLFAGGAKPSALFFNDGKKGGEGGAAGSKVIAGIKAAYRTATASGGFTEPMVLDDGWKYEQMALTSADAQFAEMRVEQVNEIARVFRVPPHLLFELSRATWSNAEEMFQSFLTLTLRSWLDAWEWAYARVLFTPEERKSFYVEFVIDDLMTANSATRATTYQQYRAMGVLTANEVRAGLNREPLEGGDVLSNPNITPGAPAGDNDNAKPKKEAA